ncbi:MAG: riboflavin synthase [Polyangiaceae bacterium]
MFTGLVETLGKLEARKRAAKGARLVIHAGFEGLVLGESIAVDGVCLTVDRILPGGFEADASSETLARTTLGALSEGSRVNLERALLPTTRLGGHLVSGHVDGVGELVSREPDGESEKLTFEMPASLSKYVAEKGSITVNGISLTVNGVTGSTFDVMIIPHTLARTTLSDLGARSGAKKVNLEVDILARYVARLLGHDAPGDGSHAPHDADARLHALLERKGYV